MAWLRRLLCRWICRGLRGRTLGTAQRPGFELVWIPTKTAKLVGTTCARRGVVRKVAIAAAIWAFGHYLTEEDRAEVIRDYLGWHNSPERKRSLDVFDPEA